MKSKYIYLKEREVVKENSLKEIISDDDTGFKYYLFTDAESEEEFDSYINKCKALSLYEIEARAQYGDQLITLSTCEYSRTNGRMVVVAKKVI